MKTDPSELAKNHDGNICEPQTQVPNEGIGSSPTQEFDTNIFDTQFENELQMLTPRALAHCKHLYLKLDEHIKVRVQVFVLVQEYVTEKYFLEYPTGF